MNITPPLKWHGGKQPLARRIVELMPPHLHYAEPFAGGLAVLLARDPGDRRLWLAPHKGVSEVANDLDGRVVNFWRVIRAAEQFPRFQRLVEAMPFARAEWEQARRHVPRGDAVEDAVAFFVLARQSLAGRMKCFAPQVRTRVRRGMADNVSAWLNAVDGLADVHARLRPVVVENKPAVDFILAEDMPSTLFYCDPPYLHATRATTRDYACEMTERQHRELLSSLKNVKGKVLLSGYPSPLYDCELASWNRHTFDVANRAAGGRCKRRMREVVWCNY